jgi:hypothetical protein
LPAGRRVYRFTVNNHAIGAFTLKARITKIRNGKIVLKAGLTEHGHGGLTHLPEDAGPVQTRPVWNCMVPYGALTQAVNGMGEM